MDFDSCDYHLRNSLWLPSQEFFVITISESLFDYHLRYSLWLPSQEFFVITISGILCDYHLRNSLWLPSQEFFVITISGVVCYFHLRSRVPWGGRGKARRPCRRPLFLRHGEAVAQDRGPPRKKSQGRPEHTNVLSTWQKEGGWEWGLSYSSSTFRS